MCASGSLRTSRRRPCPSHRRPARQIRRVRWNQQRSRRWRLRLAWSPWQRPANRRRQKLRHRRLKPIPSLSPSQAQRTGRRWYLPIRWESHRFRPPIIERTTRRRAGRIRKTPPRSGSVRATRPSRPPKHLRPPEKPRRPRRPSRPCLRVQRHQPIAVPASPPVRRPRTRCAPRRPWTSPLRPSRPQRPRQRTTFASRSTAATGEWNCDW